MGTELRELSVPPGGAVWDEDYPVSPHLAQALGLEKAVILGRVHRVLEAEGFERDGQKWVRLAVEDWYEFHFPWSSKSSVGRHLKSLRDDDGLLLQTTEYRFPEQPAYDNTPALTIAYEALDELLANTPRGVPTKRNKRKPEGERQRLGVTAPETPDVPPQPQAEASASVGDVGTPNTPAAEPEPGPGATAAVPPELPEISPAPSRGDVGLAGIPAPELVLLEDPMALQEAYRRADRERPLKEFPVPAKTNAHNAPPKSSDPRAELAKLQTTRKLADTLTPRTPSATRELDLRPILSHER